MEANDCYRLKGRRQVLVRLVKPGLTFKMPANHGATMGGTTTLYGFVREDLTCCYPGRRRVHEGRQCLTIACKDFRRKLYLNVRWIYGVYEIVSIRKKALKAALEGFEGEVFLFGSRLDPDKRGGDIDILLKPINKSNRYELKSKIASKFERALEQSLDVVVYNEQNIFCQEVMKYAQRFDPASL